jgi:hypothetical protein
MRPLLKTLVTKTLGAVNVFPTIMTEKGELLSLLKKLHPISSDKELIRLGPKADGGYLIPDDFVGIEACFSPGVGFLSGFEKDCAELGMEVFLADRSVEKPADEHQQFHIFEHIHWYNIR